MLIDYSYFVGEINIPGAVVGSPIKERLDFFILQYQRELLEALFGYGLAKEITEAAAGALSPSMADMLDGHHLSADAVDIYKWKGLRQAEGPYKGSMIANYIYYWWTRDQVTVTTSLGETAPKTENDTRATSARKQARAWNKMAEDVRLLKGFMDQNGDAYPTWDKAAFQKNYHNLSTRITWIL